MKQIGTTENGILMEITEVEASLLKQFDLPAMLKVRSLVNEIAAVFSEKVLTVKVKVKRHYKKRVARTEPAQAPTAEKKLTLVETAIDVMKRIKTPCTLEDVVSAMKDRGCVFKSDNPIDSLGVNLTATKAAILVGRDGKKGLWMINGPDAITERKKYLISLGKSQG